MSATEPVGFWVVLYPTPTSTFQDICFEADPVSFGRQMMGGLRAGNVAAFTRNQLAAVALASSLLNDQKAS